MTEVHADGGGADTSTSGDSATAEDAGGTSSDAAASDAGPEAGFDVRALPGLHLWLESTNGLTGNPGFESWKDSSGRWDGGTGDGQPATGVLTAVPNGVNPPTVVLNGLNGRPTLRFFDGNGSIKIENHPDLHFGTGDFAIVVVAKATAGTGFLWRMMSALSVRDGTAVSPTRFCVTEAYRGGDKCTTSATTTPDPHVFVARRNGAQLSLRIDGVVRGTYDIIGTFDVTENVQPAIIGQDLDLELSELIVIVGPTTDEKLAGLEQHLKAKFLP